MYRPRPPPSSGSEAGLVGRLAAPGGGVGPRRPRSAASVGDAPRRAARAGSLSRCTRQNWVRKRPARADRPGRGSALLRRRRPPELRAGVHIICKACALAHTIRETAASSPNCGLCPSADCRPTSWTLPRAPLGGSVSGGALSRQSGVLCHSSGALSHMGEVSPVGRGGSSPGEHDSFGTPMPH